MTNETSKSATCSNCGNPAVTNPCEDCTEDLEPGGLAAEVLAASISDILSFCNEECFEAAGGIRRITSYEADGILTSDPGFTIRMKDGSEFQITVVQSRMARD